MTGGLVLAAGAGRRFGGPKQLAELDGRPVLEHVLAAMQAVPGLAPLVLVLGARAAEVRAGVATGAFRVVVAEDWAAGQAASLRAGVAALGRVDAALVCLGDQPRITPEVIAGTLERGAAGAVGGADALGAVGGADALGAAGAVGAAGGADAVRAAYGGVPGHPVLLGRRVLDRVPELRGDVGARELLADFRVRTWEAGHLCDPTDIDTPTQLEAMR